ncbi:MAG TPA: hypothetical protein V6D43_20535 [Candidatus Sericytochromatia bacterium]
MESLDRTSHKSSGEDHPKGVQEHDASLVLVLAKGYESVLLVALRLSRRVRASR